MERKKGEEKVERGLWEPGLPTSSQGPDEFVHGLLGKNEALCLY